MSLGSVVGSQVGSFSNSFVNTDSESSGGMLFGLMGDSQIAGQASPSSVDIAIGVQNPVPGIQMNTKTASGGGVDPPVWTDTPADMIMGALTSRALVGPEFVFGTTLNSVVGATAIAMVGGIGYTLHTNWLPTGTFMVATTGKNLFNTWVDRMKSLALITGKAYSGTVINLGGNDVTAGFAANYQADLVALCAAIRVAFGSTHPIVVLKTPATTAIDPTGLNTIRTAQATVDAADAFMTLVDVDDLQLLPDNLHYGSSATVVAGARAAFGLTDLKGFARLNVTVPTLMGWGPAEFGAGDLSPEGWGGERDGDLQIMHVQTGITSGLTIPTPATWTALGTTTTTSAAGVFTEWNVYGRVLSAGTIAANNGHSPPTTVSIAGASRENLAKIFCFRGPSAMTLANVEVVSLWAENNFASPKTAPGITTLTNGALVAVISGFWAGGGGRFQEVTNSNIQGFTEYQDGDNLMASTNGASLAITAGIKVTAGATGTFNIVNTGPGTLIGGATILSIKP